MGRRQEFDVAALDYRFMHADEPQPSLKERSERWQAAARPSAPRHRVEANIGGQQVGYLDWHPRNGMVDMVKVAPEHRGKGIASALWGVAHVHAARHGLVPPKHSDVQLPDGRHWANKQTVNSGPGKKQPRRPKPGPVEGQEALF